MALTDEQKKKYLDNPNHCPYCGSVSFDCESIYVEYRYAFQKITCLECSQQWTDEYKLSTVFTPDEEAD